MLNAIEAEQIVLANLPGSQIKKFIEYKNLFVFHVILDRPNEQDLDPFYSVDKSSRRFNEFSIITDGDISEITRLFLAKP